MRLKSIYKGKEEKMKIIIETMTLSNKSRIWIDDRRSGSMQSKQAATICNSNEEVIAEVRRVLSGLPKIDPEVQKQIDAANAKILKDYADQNVS